MLSSSIVNGTPCVCVFRISRLAAWFVRRKNTSHTDTLCVLIWPSRREWLCLVRSLIQTHTQTHESIRALWVCLCVCVLSTQSSPPLATQLENMCICVVFMGLRVGRWVELSFVFGIWQNALLTFLLSHTHVCCDVSERCYESTTTLPCRKVCSHVDKCVRVCV